MTRQELALLYAKQKHTCFIAIPSFKDWLLKRGETSIDSVLRVLRYDKTKEMQFAKKVIESPTTYQILELAEVEPEEEVKSSFTILPARSRESWDEEQSKYNFKNFQSIDPAYLVCNYCGSQFSASYYSTLIRVHQPCPKCSHLQR